MFGPFHLPTHIRGLETAYRDGGVPALHKEHLALVSRSRSYRIVLKLVDLVFPVSVAFELAGCFDEQVKEHGLREAANAFPDRSAIPWETVLPRRGWHTVMTSPAVIYCNHPSLITPFFMAALKVALNFLGSRVCRSFGSFTPTSRTSNTSPSKSSSRS